MEIWRRRSKRTRRRTPLRSTVAARLWRPGPPTPSKGSSNWQQRRRMVMRLEQERSKPWKSELRFAKGEEIMEEVEPRNTRPRFLRQLGAALAADSALCSCPEVRGEHRCFPVLRESHVLFG